MKEQLENQQKLMELVVAKVLRKHGVLDNKVDLDKKEKEKITEIVANIKSDVDQFLKNTKVAKTENDFPELNEVENAIQITKKIKRNSVVLGENDLNNVKRFL